MSLYQVILTWSMMSIQGCRRLYESLVFGKQSSSRMWIGHWAMGILFYLAMSVAVWIEGSCTSTNSIASELAHSKSDAILHSSALLPPFQPPSLKTFVAIPLFILASGLQYDCHYYLSSLKKYSVPSHPVFQTLVCPHYFAECLIYLSLSIVAAPPGNMLNRTISSAFIFVVINLGYTAKTSRSWYEAKFGKESVQGRWNMIPYVF